MSVLRTCQRGLAGVVVAGASLFALSGVGSAGAAPAHNDGLTIAATPNPILAGESVLIYGQLNGADNADQTITLFHRIYPQSAFTVISRTKTSPAGFYDFPRPEGIVMSNRSWFVRGPDGAHSRTIHEGVAALVSLSSDKTAADTGQAVVFSGHVSPTHVFERVKLQEQTSLSGNGWSTIATTYTGAASNFSVPHRWAVPGIYTLRAVFPGDARNLEGDSDSVTLIITQKQVPSFTINSSAPIIPIGQSVTISGVLYRSGSTVTVDPSTQVTLYGKPVGGTSVALATALTGPDGSYSFPQSPSHNEVYNVGTAILPTRVSASLFEGVQDAVTVGASSPTGTVGGTVSLSGTVSPDHTGHVIYLQRLGSDGYWHDVATRVVNTGSTFSFTYTFGEAGTIQLRGRIFGGPENVGGASAPVAIVVSGVASISALPPAS
jgi:hypothetical protein